MPDDATTPERDHGPRARTGVWLVGARGSVATTTATGLLGLLRGAPPTGVVTAGPAFAAAPLPGLDELVLAGHDLVDTPLVKRAEALADEGVVPHTLVREVADDLERTDARVRPAPLGGATTPAAVAALTDELRTFRRDHDLDHLVVIDVSSAEPAPTWDRAPTTDADLDAALTAGTAPPSVVAALGALEAGAAYVDFTPGAATTVPAVIARAEALGLPLVGRDGKTGETLVKTVLAPLFADRALHVRSWVGTNLLGGGDGRQLEDPANAEGKLATKGQSLESILGAPVTQRVHIDHVPDLGEWKTAWDHVHFEGFLGTAMNLQFTWQGCDSALAAPLVIDLARLTSLALQRGESGQLPAFGFFFKDPLGTDEHRLDRQLERLVAWALDS